MEDYPSKNENQQKQDSYMHKTSGEYHRPDSAQDPREKKKSGLGAGLSCLGCGALGCVGIFVLSIILMILAGNWMKNNLVAEESMEIPDVYVSSTEKEQINEKLERFKAELKENKNKVVTLNLTPKEMNYILQKDMKVDDPVMYISVAEDGLTTFLFSIPFVAEGETLTSSQFVNASGSGFFGVENGKFITNFKDLTIGKVKLPAGDFLEGFSEGFAEEITTSEEYKNQPYRIENMNVTNENIKLEIKRIK
ncbi:MAG: hypothetical protein ACLFQV_08335 [Vulcanimicrobiota bacterium]